MNYKVRFPNNSIQKRLEKVLSKIHKSLQSEIIEAIEHLANDPRPFGRTPFKKLRPPVQFYQLTAQYRIRIENYRVLYDIDDKKKIVWVLALRKRSETTYK
ncbi:MAG: type II toxin-antitoxin system RelE/ParE family toxin [Candidatus Omnitrophica bacterium]|nr:type II toxin-antitoxin system RelE/ParE family toxin [Candidatus Omnitrophota bacterium]